jgi:TusA-related sulfurtransferase
MPLALAKVRIAEVAPGAALVLLATDPEASIDLAAWAAEEGHGFAERDAGEWREYELRRAG